MDDGEATWPWIPLSKLVYRPRGYLVVTCPTRTRESHPPQRWRTAEEILATFDLYLEKRVALRPASHESCDG